MMTVKEVCRISGVSARTLHHYDAIGLLKPAHITEAGYRMYDTSALKRLHSILFFKELQFPLKEIKLILDDPNFDPQAAISQQIELLKMQRDHITDLINHAKEIQSKGELIMNNDSFNIFDTSEAERYKEEVKRLWGKTKAYSESEQKSKSIDPNAAGKLLMDMLAEIGRSKQLAPSDDAIQEKVAELRQFITDNFYTCTLDIFRDLGEMYVSDERFKRNIDNAGGEGTAEFVSRAIAEYCKKK